MIWHQVFGIEANIEALLSPTHLILAVGSALIVTGPLRAAWLRSPARTPSLPALLPGPGRRGPAAVAAHVLYRVCQPDRGGDCRAGTHRPTEWFFVKSLRIASILLQAGFMMGVLLFLLRRWLLPFGSVLVVLGLSAFLAVSIHLAYWLLPFSLAAGIAGDLWIGRFKPTPENPGRFRWFAFGLPVLYFALYFATLALTGGVWWTIHMWAGSIVMAGIVGWLLSYAFLPPNP